MTLYCMYWKLWTVSIGGRVCELCLTALFSLFDGRQYVKHANFRWADIGTAAAALYTWQWLIWWLFIWSIVVLVLCSFLKAKVHRQIACYGKENFGPFLLPHLIMIINFQIIFYEPKTGQMSQKLFPGTMIKTAIHGTKSAELDSEN